MGKFIIVKSEMTGNDVLVNTDYIICVLDNTEEPKGNIILLDSAVSVGSTKIDRIISKDSCQEIMQKIKE